VKTIKVMSVFGTRPEATKMAPLVRALEAASPHISSKVVISAQHRSMLDQVLRDFGIAADYDLDIMREGQTLSETTERVLRGFTPILESERPDLVLVHGDTATTASAALCSYYQKIRCGHVEAGLRTGDKYAPFPEEIMRHIADRISDMHFAPTQLSKQNLLREGFGEESIYVTGNTAVDALLLTVRDGYIFKDPRLNEIDFESRRNILVEVHRRENFGQGMEDIGAALREIAETRDDIQLLVSVHKNPRAGEPVKRRLAAAPRTVLFDPLDYPDYVNLMGRCYLVVTDSGGAQEEAPSLGVPVILCRDLTERPEAVAGGTVALVGTNKQLIVSTMTDLLDNSLRYASMSRVGNPFGDGRASERIVKAIRYSFGLAGNRPEDFSI